MNLSETLLSCLPVDYIPHSVEVFDLAVLVLETEVLVSIGDSVSSDRKDSLVRMLPCINSKQWLESANNRILIRI
jgi:hypothetical protein